MKPYQATILNAAILVVFGLWAYLNVAAESRSMTILIPVFFGVILALLVPLFKQENKVVAHVVAGLTLLISIALIMPLIGSIGRADMGAVLRVGVMMAASLFALVVYIKSFIAVRRARQSAT
ncbi:MAG: hypothetical protein SH820_08475 [Xanthomonadales bacterium]|nr:hypothetical protein [Xanthomonadales bacterium]